MPDAVTIRRAVPEDAVAIADLRRTVFPYLPASAEQIRRDLSEPFPARKSGQWVAVTPEGTVAGYASCALNTWTSEAGRSEAGLFVHPDHRSRGIGSALTGTVGAHLASIGAVRVQVFVPEASADFARRRGFEQTRSVHYVRADLRSLPEQPPAPDGAELVPVSEVEPRLVYDADAAATLDEPTDSPADSIDYDEWLHEIWTAPMLRHDLSVAALADGKVVSFTAVESDGVLAWSGMTGTLRSHRGRGLAKVVKSAALRRARDAGILTAATSMDDRNGAMLAVNTWLGYRPVATHLGLTRSLI